MTKLALDVSSALIRISGVKQLEGEDIEDTAVRALAIVEERFQRAEFEKKDNARRVNEILDVVMSLAALDYSRRAGFSELSDHIDALAGGVNMLGEELKQSTISLKEKEVLLREIHHRVKNNLQIISSLLNLQSSQIEDERARQQYAVSHERIRAMALVHEKLYESKDLSGIDFGDYVYSLAHALNLSCNPDPSRIRLHIDVDQAPVQLKLDAAIPCALILNELIMNGFKHAFPGERSGEISVRFVRAEETNQLVVSDNGIGLPPHFDIENASSLGLQLVTVLSEQVDAKLQIVSEGGTKFVLNCYCP
jgi:two-component sensor histidine kinase